MNNFNRYFFICQYITKFGKSKKMDNDTKEVILLFVIFFIIIILSVTYGVCAVTYSVILTGCVLFLLKQYSDEKMVGNNGLSSDNTPLSESEKEDLLVDSVLNINTSDTDFDGYKNKPYIPGYTDVGLYNKDGRPTFAVPIGVTKSGLLRFEGSTLASRADNAMSHYNNRLQLRAKENIIRQTNRVKPYYDNLNEELNANEYREWWNQDNLYDRVGKLT